MTPAAPFSKPRLHLLAALSSLLLAACGGGSGGGDDDHDEALRIDSAGRLALIEANSPSLRLYELDSASVLSSFALANTPSAVYASPGHRHALAVQRTQDLVQIADGGLWQEDHVDHLHDYKQAPKLLAARISGARPTHYETHEGRAAFFMDGVAAENRSAQVQVFNEAAIASGTPESSLTLPLAMHGTAEPRGNFLLSTWRATDAASTLPSHVELYRRNGSSWQFVQRFDTPCPDLHGSFSNKDHSAFGCSDGVLLVTQSGESFTARKLANPADMPANARIGTVIGHSQLTTLVGLASPGLVYEIDPVAGGLKKIAWAEGRTRRAHAFDRQGGKLMLLDDLGTLHLLDARRQWAAIKSLAAVPAMPTAAPFPSMATSQARDEAWISDPLGRQLLPVDTAAATLRPALKLDFAPAGLAWLGIKR